MNIYLYSFVLEPADYASAVASCATAGQGSQLVTLANFQDALDAKDSAANSDPDNELALLESFRLDAQHNETCYTNTNGDKIDLDSSGFSVNLPSDVASPQVLVVNEENGNITAEQEDATIGTVCQYDIDMPMTTQVRWYTVDECQTICAVLYKYSKKILA